VVRPALRDYGRHLEATMATRDKQRDTLQIIFSFFLGLMVVAFIGVGVNTFYPSPDQRPGSALQKLYDERNSLDMARGKTGALSPAEERQYKELSDKITVLEKKLQKERDIWARNTSIVLITFATLIMGISLIRAEQLRVISSGLLLGGLFAMVYGAGWSFAGGDSKARFVVVTVALVVTLVLGYLKFVRAHEAEDEEPAAALPPTEPPPPTTA
jgi:hypothetical protein